MMIVLGALCIGFASIIGGATGFGSALISTPLMLLFGFSVPEVVVINLVMSLVTGLNVAYRLRDHIEWTRVALLGGGGIPGAWLGAETVNLLPEHDLKLAAGAVVMLAGIGMAIPTRRQARDPSAAAQVATGVVGGYLSTTTSLNGPPPVLLLTRARLPPLNFIADLAGYFVVINAVSLVILWFRNEVPPGVTWPMLSEFVAAALVGNLAGLWIARQLPVKVFRSTVIVLVIIAGALTIASGLQ
jgi:uncharacterized membrane protein YfcA